jgi:Glucose-6-phosphate dehydrogenase, NAD binding domain
MASSVINGTGTTTIESSSSSSSSSSLCILIFGASGDVAKKKIYPALLELYNARYISSTSESSKPAVPSSMVQRVNHINSNNNNTGATSVQIYGFARTKMTTIQFRNHLRYGYIFLRFHINENKSPRCL